MRICIMGAGPVGGYFGALLARAGNSVFFISRGRRLLALKKRPLRVESINGSFSVRVKAADDPHEFAPYDLVLFTVKNRDTEGAIKALRGSVGRATIILPLQNGLDCDKILKKHFGGRVIGGVAFIASTMKENGAILHEAAGSIGMGELSGGGKTGRVERLATVFKNASIPCSVYSDFREAKWKKLSWNICFNPLSVIFETTAGNIIKNKHARNIGERLMKEAISIARKKGLRLREKKLIEWNFTPHKGLDNFRTSMLQDYLNGRSMEIEGILGSVLRESKKYGLSVPCTQAVYDILKCKEELNLRKG